jgi:general secretion pathway protein L
LNAWAWREKAALEGKRTAIRNTLLSTFPDVPVVLDAPLQMEREVNALRQTTGAVSGRDLEAILGAVSLAVPAGQALTAIDFVSGEARLKGMQLNPAQADSLVTQLKAHGYTARFEGEQLLVQQESSQ